MQKLKIIIFGGLLIFVLLFMIGNVCPIEHIIGIPCPGCNMFTALYWLLIKLDMQTAYYFHPAVFALVAYVVILFLCYAYYHTWEKVIKNKYIIVLGVVFIIFLAGIYVYRMMTIFPNEPMMFNHDAFLPKLLE